MSGAFKICPGVPPAYCLLVSPGLWGTGAVAERFSCWWDAGLTPGGPQLVGYRARLQGPTASGVTGPDLRDQWLVRVQGQTPGDPR